DKERKAAEAYIKGLESSGFSELRSVVDEDAHFAFVGFKDVHGRDNVIKAHQAVLSAFESRRFVVSRGFLTEGSHVLEWTMAGVHSSTQKPVTFRGVSLLWTKDDGAISDVHMYFDEALVNAQVGSGPKQLASVTPPQMPSGGTQEIEQA